MSSPSTDVGINDVVRLDLFLERYPAIWRSPSQAKWAIYNREYNGLAQSGALTKRGNRWFVVVPRLVEWVTTGDR